MQTDNTDATAAAGYIAEEPASTERSQHAFEVSGTVRDEMDSVIWTFSTGAGSVRLLLGGAGADLRALQPELHAAASMSDDVEEFVAVAARLCEEHRVLLAEVLRSLAPDHEAIDLRQEVRKAASMSDPFEASEVVVSALRQAERTDVEAFATDAAWENERAYLRDLLYSLDEYKALVAAKLVDAVGEGTASLLLG